LIYTGSRKAPLTTLQVYLNIKILNELERLFHTTPTILLSKHKLKNAIHSTFGIELDNLDYNNLGELVDRIDDAVLARYFGSVWQPQTKKFKYSGLRLIDEINALNPTRVLDLGCGYNEFKGKIQNLTGIDPYNKNADEQVTILDYQPSHQFDVILCLGSINFGSTEKILAELQKAVQLTKPGGLLFFRVNPGHSHPAEESNWISFYNWTPSFIINTADLLNVEILDLRNDSNKRIYFVLRR